ncbi:hypothetical protein CLOM_g12879 [Closterium sp. NIES-68]|nr:hypothetical protein CLOM_g12879 [Closterium sp. NIES-68]GJP83131.1 hypothetical protein CLOP_g13331 [Closterium sp. NIES-67]
MRTTSSTFCDASPKTQEAPPSPWSPDDLDVDVFMSYNATSDACDPKPSLGDSDDMRESCISSGRRDAILAGAPDSAAQNEFVAGRTDEEIATFARLAPTSPQDFREDFTEEGSYSSSSGSSRDHWCADDASESEELATRGTTQADSYTTSEEGASKEDDDVTSASLTRDRRRESREESRRSRSRTEKLLAPVSKPLKRTHTTGAKFNPRFDHCRPLQEHLGATAAPNSTVNPQLLSLLVNIFATSRNALSHGPSHPSQATCFRGVAAQRVVNHIDVCLARLSGHHSTRTDNGVLGG